jgi:hypothetical protein
MVAQISYPKLGINGIETDAAGTRHSKLSDEETKLFDEYEYEF